MSFGDRFLQSVMGNAVRIQNEISKVVKSDSNSSNNCTACRSGFNVLHNRKRQCTGCREHFCPNCLIRLPTISGQSDRRLCNRCRIFESNFSWDDLMQLKARDLKWFLDRRRICTEGLKEKEQLADMIMFSFGSDRYYQEEARRQQRVAVMTSNMQDEFPIAGGPNEEQGPQTSADLRSSHANEMRNSADPSREHFDPPPAYSAMETGIRADPNRQPPLRDTVRQSSNVPPVQSSNDPPVQPSNDPPVQPSNDPPVQPYNDTPRQPTPNDNSRHSSSNDPCPQSDDPTAEPSNGTSRQQTPDDISDQGHLPDVNPDAAPTTQARLRVERLHLIDFKTSAEVDELSVKQLKVLLTSNHVDYRGCCEKGELVTKAKRLVASHLENVKKLAALNVAEEGPATGAAEDDLEDDMCKICMDALIDCVLLECGHMVTCLDCGKRMAECPICRQYVVRAVRIFKA